MAKFKDTVTDLQMQDNPNPTDNPTSSEIQTDEVPTAGSSDAVEVEEKATPAELLEQITDISSDINADIKSSATKEAQQKRQDDKNGVLEDDEIKEIEEFYEEESGGNGLFVGALILALIGGGIFYFKKPKKEIQESISEQLDNGVKSTTEIDEKTGMLK